jgi:hypothetical protein
MSGNINFSVIFNSTLCGGLRCYLVVLLLLWPLIVVSPLLYLVDLPLPAWQGQLVWWIERASDTFFIPVIAGAMLALAVEPWLTRRFTRLRG